MQFKGLTCALFAGAALAASNAAAIKADISALSGYLAQLTGDTQQFNSTVTGISFALQVQIDAVNIDKVLVQATKDCQSSSALNDNDSFAIGVQLLDVSNSVKTSLAAVTKKATAFADLQPIVLNSLYGLKADTDTFGAALKAKLAPLEQALAPSIISNLDSEFNAAIKAYGGTPWRSHAGCIDLNLTISSHPLRYWEFARLIPAQPEASAWELFQLRPLLLHIPLLRPFRYAAIPRSSTQGVAMRFITPVLTVLFAAASVSAASGHAHQLDKRDFGTILTDGIKIIGDLNDLTTRLQAFQGNVNDALAILNSTDNLNKDLQATSNAVAATPSLTTDQGTLLAETIATLSTPIYNVLDLLQTKRPQFQTVSGFIPTGSIVLGRLRTLKNTTDMFGANLIPKLPVELQRVAPLLTSDFDYHFIRAIQLYNQFF